MCPLKLLLAIWCNTTAPSCVISPSKERVYMSEAHLYALISLLCAVAHSKYLLWLIN